MNDHDTREEPHLSDRRRSADRLSRRAWLSAVVVAWGGQAIVTQSLLLREAIVLMFGSEFAWGVVLFAWLFGVAVGAALGGWMAERLPRPEVGLVTVLLALSVAACVELWLFRGARAWLGVEPGELLPLPKTAVAAMLFVSPAGALIGMSFPLACCIGRTHKRLLEFGHVYALESAGSLVGGALFSFWAVEHISPIQTTLLCGAVTAGVSAGLLAFSPRGVVGELQPARAAEPRSAGKQRHLPATPVNTTPVGTASIALVLVAVAAALVALLAGDSLDRRLVERRWRDIAPGYELVAQTESKYQNLAVGHRGGQFTLYCDGQVSTDFPDPYTFAPSAHFWMCQHPWPRNVLVLGGGVEGLLAEILRHPVEHVDYVEPDPRQIELVSDYLAEADRQALADPRVTVHHVDARYYVKTRRDRFDLVIARLPEPTSAQRARFYTGEFYGELRRSMTARSVLCMTAAAAPGELSAASRGYLASIRATLRRWFPHIVIGWGHPAQVLAATEAELISTDPAKLTARYTQRGVESDLFHPVWFEGATDWLEPTKLARRAADLDEAKDVRISTDLRPLVYVQRLVLWEAATSASIGSGGGGRGVIERLRSVSLAELAAMLTAMGVVTLVVCRLRRRGREGWATGAVVLSVWTTGFATMALSIVWLFAFQNLYGYVYQRIGWIIAVFMGGLVIGCALAEKGTFYFLTTTIRRGRGSDARQIECSLFLWRRLVLVDVLLGLLPLGVPFILPWLAALQSSPGTFVLVEWCVLFMVALTGLLGGAAFVLAGRLRLGSTGRAGTAAGSVVGADHAGACLGALLCGILMVPVFGTAAAAFTLAGMKFTSAVVLAVGRRFAPST